MRVYRVYAKELGDFFAGLREARGWTQSAAARAAKSAKLNVLSRNVLLRLEEGKIKNPEPDVLRALAKLYLLPYDQILGRFVRARYGSDLPWQAKELPSPSHVTSPKEVSLEVATARTLQHVTRAYEQTVNDIQVLAERAKQQFQRIASDPSGSQTPTVTRRTPRRSSSR